MPTGLLPLRVSNLHNSPLHKRTGIRSTKTTVIPPRQSQRCCPGGLLPPKPFPDTEARGQRGPHWSPKYLAIIFTNPICEILVRVGRQKKPLCILSLVLCCVHG